MREPNEIDFWRGFALVTIFVNHVPGIFFEHFTFRNVSLSDSAELFVFLAGWGLRKLTDGSAASLSARWLFFRLEGRAFTVYVAQLAITEAAIALLAAVSFRLDAPFLLDWHNASSIFYDPVRAHIGLVTLSYQLGYFNILPLYVVLLLVSPLIALAHRYAPQALPLVALAIYVGALVSGANFSTWPSEGVWFFDPLCWQMIYVLGFLLAGADGLGGFARRNLRLLRLAAIPVLTFGVIAARLHFSPDPIDLPEPKLFFVFDKTYLSPARLLHSLALVALFAGLYPTFARWAPRCCDFLSLLGRNSLNVFCAGSLLSLAGQIIRFVSGSGIVIDAAIVIFGVGSLGAVAWASEWRNRLRVKSSKASAA
ncbi:MULTISPECIES: OpgC family protein [Methylosinus]|uniref:OpgC protein n=1 Tax=Methylosinus trichosporium (strain ATCC 35070 / NCIMB 11131 / UNIQEM 75 / OB3b) TaxID=595536 RepID=A0A2D2CV00_METT3|nr:MULTISPECIES: OpgC domain-containing protein [Methylosinus]ATQ66537.1 OpgC protein [Methylosinus trichosporium OB3b]OBS52674.1 OpgC protein [Methylosinus sp. 3S-1]